jgi:hypothetical protein
MSVCLQLTTLGISGSSYWLGSAFTITVLVVMVVVVVVVVVVGR